jgi:hypothetical protein
MKYVLFLLFVVPLTSLAQLSEGEEMKQYFWNSNIGNIMEMEKDSVLLQTNFPLEVDREGKKEKWTKEQFKTKLPILFDVAVREQLKTDSPSSIESYTYENEYSPTYLLVLYPSFEEFNVMVLSFKQFNEEWKLYRIDLHAE